MDNQDKVMLATLTVIAVLAFLALLMPPSEESIRKCVEHTNYTQERCEWELTI